MPTTHYNVTFYLPVARKEGDKRPAGYWKEIGQAFVNDKGQITVKLHALPLEPWDGKLRLFPATAATALAATAGKRPPSSDNDADDCSWGDDFWSER